MTTMAELLRLIDEAGFKPCDFKGECDQLFAHIGTEFSEQKRIIIPWLFFGTTVVARVFKTSTENYDLFKGLLPPSKTIIAAPTELDQFVRNYYVQRDLQNSPLVALPDVTTKSGVEFLCEVYELGNC